MYVENRQRMKHLKNETFKDGIVIAFLNIDCMGVRNFFATSVIVNCFRVKKSLNTTIHRYTYLHPSICVMRNNRTASRKLCVSLVDSPSPEIALISSDLSPVDCVVVVVAS